MGLESVLSQLFSVAWFLVGPLATCLVIGSTVLALPSGPDRLQYSIAAVLADEYSADKLIVRPVPDLMIRILLAPPAEDTVV